MSIFYVFFAQFPNFSLNWMEQSKLRKKYLNFLSTIPHPSRSRQVTKETGTDTLVS